ncbi:MAG: transcriptional repressor LexA [Alphaproteobacteria bacterium]|jgi:repressor LexA|nr:transcriptional repressor LexA [Alphaproteobacteria bacterium]
MLTRKQHELLLFINARLEDTGISPSFDEMKEALDLKSKSGIHRLITALEERGFIRRLAHRARALEVVKLPETSAAASPASPAREDRPAPRGFSPNVIPGNFPRSRAAEQAADTRDAARDDSGEAVSLPLYGRIAAGTPIEALRDYSNTVSVPPSLLGAGDHYALEVAGDSMIDAGIHDGDTAIIQRCETAENGSIVVALVEGEEVTLKRIRKRSHAIALEPANPIYETRIFGPDQVAVQGKLVGLIRKY